jgi:hypothetical protein
MGCDDLSFNRLKVCASLPAMALDRSSWGWCGHERTAVNIHLIILFLLFYCLVDILCLAIMFLPTACWSGARA